MEPSDSSRPRTVLQQQYGTQRSTHLACSLSDGEPEFTCRVGKAEAVVRARKGIHMSDQDVAVIRAEYEAFNRAYIPAVLGAFDEQIEWTAPG